MPKLIKKASLLPLAVVASLALASCTPPPLSEGSSSTQGEVVTIKYTDNSPEQSSEAQAIVAFQETVTERTEGRVQFENYWSGSYLSGNEALAGTGDGLADMTLILTSYFPDQLPLSNVLLNHANSFVDDYPQGYLQSMASTYEMFSKETLRDEYEKHNLVPLGGFSIADEYGLLCNSPVKTVEDASGKVARVGGRAVAREVESIGMEPATIPSTEQYEALQRGVIGCGSYSPQSVISLSVWEVAKHYNFAGLSGYPGYAFVLNLDTWNKLNEGDQQILRDELPTVVEKMIENSMADFSEFATEGPKQGLSFYYDRELREKVRSAQVPPEEGNLAAVVNEWEGIKARWEKIVNDTVPSSSLLKDSNDPAKDLLQKFVEGPQVDLKRFQDALADQL